jgi:putative DNA primase/helicase
MNDFRVRTMEELERELQNERAASRANEHDDPQTPTHADDHNATPRPDDQVILDAGAITLTEDNITRAFARRHADSLLFNHRRRMWLAWDAMRWRPETTGLAFEFARRLVQTLNQEGKSRWAKASVFQAVERIAQSDRTFARVGDEFDIDTMLLNTPAGTIDLRTGATRPHSQADNITMVTGVSPSPSRHPVFDRFLDQITCGDRGLVDYLQRGLGSALSGAQPDHWLMFWHGGGRNGKNTLGDLMLYVMGDYAKKIPAATLMSDPRASRHPTEIANVCGARLAVSSEVGEGEHWDESRIKELTGDEVLSARFMRQDFFQFRRTHKHIVYGNHRPMLRIVDRAMAERLHLVPFNATFTAEAGNLDPDMPSKLRVEAAAILQWLIEGHEKWRQDGTLHRCATVETATADYFSAQSTLDMWIAERCIAIDDDGRSGRGWAKAGDLYRDYAAWKENRGERPMAATRWGEQMTSRFRKVQADGMRYIGILLRQ